MGQYPSARQPRLSGVHLHRECRVCFESGGDIIAPCQCRGTSQWIHRDCLNRWRTSRSNPRCLTNCCECGFTYVLELVRIYEEVGTARRRKFAQASIIAIGVLIQLLDTKEVLVLVTFFNFPQARGNVGHDLRNALLHHKTTYYVAGLLAFLAILGIACVFIACSHGHQAAPRDNYACADCYVVSCDGGCPECGGTPALPDCSGTGEACLLIVVLAILFFALVGLFVVVVYIVSVIQRACQQYAKLKQVRMLATEYRVCDLAESLDATGSTLLTQQAFMVPDPMRQEHMQQMIRYDIDAIFQSLEAV